VGKKIAVLGTGAIGSSVGSDLTRAGEDVWLIDQWPAHVEAMKSKGLHIQMVDGDLHVQVRALHLCEVCSLKHKFDVVFLTCKSPDSIWLTQFIKPYLASDGVLVSLQNSLNDEWLRRSSAMSATSRLSSSWRGRCGSPASSSAIRVRPGPGLRSARPTGV